MQTNPKKIKFIIFLATLLLVALFSVSIYLIIKVNIANNKIKEQQEQIEKLEKQISPANCYPHFAITINEV